MIALLAIWLRQNTNGRQDYDLKTKCTSANRRIHSGTNSVGLELNNREQGGSGGDPSQNSLPQSAKATAMHGRQGGKTNFYALATQAGPTFLAECVVPIIILYLALLYGCQFSVIYILALGLFKK